MERGGGKLLFSLNVNLTLGTYHFNEGGGSLKILWGGHIFFEPKKGGHIFFPESNIKFFFFKNVCNIRNQNVSSTTEPLFVSLSNTEWLAKILFNT